jgi:hypothetical protein
VSSIIGETSGITSGRLCCAVFDVDDVYYQGLEGPASNNVCIQRVGLPEDGPKHRLQAGTRNGCGTLRVQGQEMKDLKIGGGYMDLSGNQPLGKEDVTSTVSCGHSAMMPMLGMARKKQILSSSSMA